MMNYKVEDWNLLPVANIQKAKAFFKEEFNIEKNINYETFFDNTNISSQIFEPNQKTLLKNIMPMYITNVIYQAILEAQASELASRMTAMSAATNNAQDMITHLTIDYNKARQAGITNEITEVISGANSV